MFFIHIGKDLQINDTKKRALIGRAFCIWRQISRLTDSLLNYFLEFRHNFDLIIFSFIST